MFAAIRFSKSLSAVASSGVSWLGKSFQSFGAKAMSSSYQSGLGNSRKSSGGASVYRGNQPRPRAPAHPYPRDDTCKACCQCQMCKRSCHVLAWVRACDVTGTRSM